MLEVRLYGGPSDGMIMAIPADRYPDEVSIVAAEISGEMLFSDDFDPNEFARAKRYVYSHSASPRYRFFRIEEGG